MENEIVEKAGGSAGSDAVGENSADVVELQNKVEEGKSEDIVIEPKSENGAEHVAKISGRKQVFDFSFFCMQY